MSLGRIANSPPVTLYPSGISKVHVVSSKSAVTAVQN